MPLKPRLAGGAREQTPSWVENSPSRISRLQLREALRSRDVAGLLALRELQLRYRQTVLGVAWALLQPLAGMAVAVIVVNRLLSVSTDSSAYAEFVYVGLAVWFYISSATATAAESLTRDPALVTKVYFPRVLAPVAAVLPALLDLGLTVGAFIPLHLILGGSISIKLALVPLCMVGAAFLALSVGLWLAALNVFYRDVRYALPFALQIWLFASPVLYAVDVTDSTTVCCGASIRLSVSSESSAGRCSTRQCSRSLCSRWSRSSWLLWVARSISRERSGSSPTGYDDDDRGQQAQ